MTILIAALDRGDVILAADGQATDGGTKVLCEHEQKVARVTQNIAVGASGNATMALMALRRAFKKEDWPLDDRFLERLHNERNPLPDATWKSLRSEIGNCVRAVVAEWKDIDEKDRDLVIVMGGRDKGKAKLCIWHSKNEWNPKADYLENRMQRHIFTPTDTPEDITQQLNIILCSDAPLLPSIREAISIVAEREAKRPVPQVNGNMVLIRWKGGFTAVRETVYTPPSSKPEPSSP